MLFSSIVFLSFFLPLVTVLYFIARQEFRNTILLIASLVFYTFGEPVYVLALIGVTGVTWLAALVLNALPRRGGVFSALFYGVLITTVSGILGVLFYFKYRYFAGDILIRAGWIDEPFAKTVLPLGISFYTFQSLSYLADVAAKTVPAEKNPLRLLLYISFFPQLVAGPILKYHDIAPQLTNRVHTLANAAAGLRRFMIGLGKKVLIANTLGETVDKIFALPADELSVAVCWIGAAFYTLQLYYDFSGYSDMAIGLGRLFGFRFKENFNYPYVARSLTDFWRRWHMSLSGWFKEYVYIPLGGNKRGFIRTLFNLGLVFFLTGLWHGADWTFIVWGLWHGGLIIAEKILKKIDDSAFPRFLTPFKHVYLIIAVLIGWVIFRADSLSYAHSYLGVMLGLNTSTPDYGLFYYVSEFQLIVFALAALGATGILKNAAVTDTEASAMQITLSNLWCFTVLAASFLFLVANSFNPFIYFRF